MRVVEGVEDWEGEERDEGATDGLRPWEPGCGAHFPAEGLRRVLVDEGFGGEGNGGEEEDCEGETEAWSEEEVVDFRVPG